MPRMGPLVAAQLVDRVLYAKVISTVKTECKGAARKLMAELKARFPEQHVLNALGVVYPQYWANGGGLDTFSKHLEILKGFYCEPKWIGDGTEGSKGRKLVSPLLDSWKLES